LVATIVVTIWVHENCTRRVAKDCEREVIVL
jgi:hypothetical protein